MDCLYHWQLMLHSDTKYFAKGSIIAESHMEAKALMVITSGLVCTRFDESVVVGFVSEITTVATSA